MYELAKELGLESKEILSFLADQGENVRSASSTLDAPAVRRLRAALTTSPLADAPDPSQPEGEALCDLESPSSKEPLALAPASPGKWRIAVEKVRVHELAQELDLSSRDLLAILSDQGDNVASPRAVLEPAVVRRLRAKLKSPGEDTQLSDADRSALRARSPIPANLSTEERRLGLNVDEARIGSSSSGWHAGAVPLPTGPILLHLIREIRQDHPVTSTHLEVLQRLGSQFVHVSRCRNKGFEGVWFVRVRLSGAIETGFGFTREVLFTYSPFVDLQSRIVSQITEELRGRAERATPDIVFVSSPDPRLRTKLDDWSSPNLLLIPLDASISESPLNFISLLREFLYTRDLFYETTPVRGSKFFGRRKLLRALRDDVKSRSVSGVFGLRKAGKTSVLTELSDNVDDHVVPILMDLEVFPAPPDDPTPHILADLRLRLRDALEERKLGAEELVGLPDQPSITQWKTATQTLLKKLHTTGVSVLLMLDEVEYLTSDKVDIQEGELPQISQLLGAFRSLVQETQNFTFILSGLTSAITESGRLYGRPNPLFSWAKSYYLGPFDKMDADELATSVGGRMGISIDPGGLQALHDGSGGHAFLYRSLASKTVQSLPTDVFRRHISATEVQRAYLPWKMGIAGNVREMLDHVERYYSTEAILLEMLRDEPESFSEVVDLEPQALKHLLDLGLVQMVDGRYRLNSLLDLV